MNGVRRCTDCGAHTFVVYEGEETCQSCGLVAPDGTVFHEGPESRSFADAMGIYDADPSRVGLPCEPGEPLITRIGYDNHSILSRYNERCARPSGVGLPCAQTRRAQADGLAAVQTALNLPDCTIKLAHQILAEYSRAVKSSYKGDRRKCAFIAAAVYHAALEIPHGKRTIEEVRGRCWPWVVGGWRMAGASSPPQFFPR